ncbi:TlpA family protein disulfide reductase [Carboxylicivirga marina]|uniref:TlpA family protein disulfide reductase n=1 Tax=Carboxylicivirga marina TaxID=2800988 RepID=A0ABS1HKM6_9BACT|nr:TlpA disulfide reductase family protein [Carboxylicivirga marina]MBK3518201.1 TlpA family protein disulfide reductase [Carboxylicivirga marina]
MKTIIKQLNILTIFALIAMMGVGCTPQPTTFKIIKGEEGVYLPFIQVEKERVEVEFNENKEFNLDVTGFETPFTVRYHAGGKMKNAYVSAGSSQVIILSKTDAQHTGDNAAYAEYLNARKVAQAELLSTDGVTEAIAKVRAIIKQNIEELHSHDLGDVFNALQETNFTYLGGIKFMSWLKNLPNVKELGDDDASIQFVTDLLSKKGVMTPTYQDYAGAAIPFLAVRKLDEPWGYDEYIEAVIKMTVNTVERDGGKDQMINYYIGRHIKYVGVNGVKPVVELARTKITNPEELEKLNTLYAKWEHLEPGNKVPNWTFKSIDDKEVSLSDFKGKYVYIDLWATWCTPCVKEIPYIQELEKEFHGQDIVFVGISRDEDVEKWKNKVVKDNLQGIQVNEGGNVEFANFLNITSIPRFVLIGKDGEMLNAVCSRPSDPKTRTLLTNLLKN